MKKIQLLPNVITAFGLTCGLFVIFKTNMIDPGDSSYDTLLVATIILILAGFFDILDGAVARATKGVSEFGGMFDSLSDAITFGVAPSVLMLKALALEPGTDLSLFATSGAMVYSVCGVLRLVRFTVTQMPTKEQVELATAKKNFIGLPIPGAAGAAISANLFLESEEFRAFFVLDQATHTYILTSVMFLIGYLLVSRWRFPTLTSFQFKVPSFQLVSAVVISAVLLFFGILQHFALVLLILCWGYIIVALSLGITRMISGRRFKALNDFEPIDEE